MKKRRIAHILIFSFFILFLTGNCGDLRYFQNARVNVTQAITLCCNEDMILVTIENATEHVRIEDYVESTLDKSSTYNDFWIGLYYDQSTTAFYWMSDGSQVSYTDWDSNEPDDLPPGGSSGNVRIKKDTYKFRTIFGTGKYDVLCETPGANPAPVCQTTSTTPTTTTTTQTTTTSSTTSTTTSTTTPTTTTTTAPTTTTTTSTTTPTTITTATTPTTTTTSTTTPTTTTTSTTPTTATTSTTTPVTTTITTTPTTTTTNSPTSTTTTTQMPTTTSTTTPLTTTPQISTSTTSRISTNPPTTRADPGTTAQAATSSEGTDNTWAMVGGVLGGVGGLAVLTAVSVCLKKLLFGGRRKCDLDDDEAARNNDKRGKPNRNAERLPSRSSTTSSNRSTPSSNRSTDLTSVETTDDWSLRSDTPRLLSEPLFKGRRNTVSPSQINPLATSGPKCSGLNF